MDAANESSSIDDDEPRAVEIVTRVQKRDVGGATTNGFGHRRVVEVEVVKVRGMSSASDRPRTNDGRLDFLELQMQGVQERLAALEMVRAKDPGRERSNTRKKRTAPIALDEDDMPTDIHRIEISESIWEAPIILGMHPVGVAGRLFTWLLVFVNAALQGLLVYIIAVGNLDKAQITSDDLNDFGEWRRNSAHASRYMDSLTQKSMAAQICEGSAAIVHSAGQQNIYQIISDYLGDRTDGEQRLRPGAMMACLAVIVWSLSIFKEVCATLRLLDAVLCLETGDGHPARGREPGSLEIVSATRSRKLIVTLLCAARLCLAALLLLYGGSFLAYTIEIDELLLNGT
jgi:hypothetical protein